MPKKLVIKEESLEVEVADREVEKIRLFEGKAHSKPLIDAMREAGISVNAEEDRKGEGEE